jgi:hypothetical protein
VGNVFFIGARRSLNRFNPSIHNHAHESKL